MNICITWEWSYLPYLFSFAALIMSILAYQHSKQSRKSSIFTELVQQANVINEAIAQYKIRGPYAVLLGFKSRDDIEEFESLATVFFHHINLLNMVYRNRTYLGKEVENAYRDWVKNIFKPWLASDQKLIQIWDLTRKKKDLLGKDFMNWLEPQLGTLLEPTKSN